MKINYLLIAMTLIVAGCAQSRLDFKEEPLTGQKYCVASNKLIASKNSESADFSLKYTKDDSLKKAPLRTTLGVFQKGREYNINPHESLKLIIDGVSYNLDITNSFQNPLEVVTHNPVSLPGGTLMLGSVNELTARAMLFFLSLDYLSKMITAKRVEFEISAPSTENSPNSQGYPIVLELNPESIAFLKDFQDKCVNNFPN